MPDQVEVTQEDREAAAERIAIWGDVEAATEAHKVRQGEGDEHGFVQAFARHRQAAVQKARADADLLRAVGMKLAIASGELNVALDGQEKYRAQRQAVLDAMKEFAAAASAHTAIRSLTEREVSREG